MKKLFLRIYWYITTRLSWKIKELIFGIRKGDFKEITIEVPVKIKLLAYHNLNSKSNRGYDIYDEVEHYLIKAIDKIKIDRDPYSINYEIIDVDIDNTKPINGWDDYKDLILKDGKLFFGCVIKDLE